MPPDTLNVWVDRIEVSPTAVKPVWLDSHVRSTRLENDRPSTKLDEIGNPAESKGNRIVVVRSVPAGVLTDRNSGSSCRWIIGRVNDAMAAGLRADSGSNSPRPPPAPRDDVLSCPVGYPNPCVLRLPCARIGDA